MPETEDSSHVRGCSPFVEMGHPKAKIGKSQCKNEKELNPNPEFSYS